MENFFKNLIATFSIKPAGARTCEFCGGVKCFGACGTVETPTEKIHVTGKTNFTDPDVGYFICKDGTQFSFNRHGQVGKKMQEHCPEGNCYTIKVTVRKGVIKSVLETKNIPTNEQ